MVAHSARRRMLATTTTVIGVCPLLVLALPTPAWASSTTDLVSRASHNAHGDCQSTDPQTTKNGRLIVFESCANNWVKNDNNASGDIFLRDRGKGKLTLISHARGHAKRVSNGESSHSSISGDGRYVAFVSSSSNLVKGDHNKHADVFRYDRKTKKMTLVSPARSGGKGGNGDALGDTAISDNGRFVAYASDASNLVKGDNNHARDVFMWDAKVHKTILADAKAGGGVPAKGSTTDPDLSANGRYVAFTSFSTDIVSGDNTFPDIFVYDRKTKRSFGVSTGEAGVQHLGESPSIDASGHEVCYAHPEGDVYAVHLPGNDATPGPNAFIDESTGIGGAQANSNSSSCVLNRSGSRIAFASGASNLVGGDTNQFFDVFVRSVGGGAATRVSVSNKGAQGNAASPAYGDTTRIDLSKSGHTVVFDSVASNLAKGDKNNAVDVFARIL